MLNAVADRKGSTNFGVGGREERDKDAGRWVTVEKDEVTAQCGSRKKNVPTSLPSH